MTEELKLEDENNDEIKVKINDKINDEINDESKDEIKDEITDTLIYSEKEKEIKFSLSFKWTLGISIFLTGILSSGGVFFLTRVIIENMWNTLGVNFLLRESLAYISVMICFVALINIAVIKKPFSRILVWCTSAIGILFVTASFIFPQIAGYKSGFVILSNGKFTLIDGTIFMIGVLVVLFSKLIQFGFIYQNNSDMTV
ncbi:MAG: hypothetical protein ACYDEX_04995 [Mobilitalea sp.]